VRAQRRRHMTIVRRRRQAGVAGAIQLVADEKALVDEAVELVNTLPRSLRQRGLFDVVHPDVFVNALVVELHRLTAGTHYELVARIAALRADMDEHPTTGEIRPLVHKIEDGLGWLTREADGDDWSLDQAPEPTPKKGVLTRIKDAVTAVTVTAPAGDDPEFERDIEGTRRPRHPKPMLMPVNG